MGKSATVDRRGDAPHANCLWPALSDWSASFLCSVDRDAAVVSNVIYFYSNLFPSVIRFASFYARTSRTRVIRFGSGLLRPFTSRPTGLSEDMEAETVIFVIGWVACLATGYARCYRQRPFHFPFIYSELLNKNYIKKSVYVCCSIFACIHEYKQIKNLKMWKITKVNWLQWALSS